jgi:hypothetical protein
MTDSLPGCAVSLLATFTFVLILASLLFAPARATPRSAFRPVAPRLRLLEKTLILFSILLFLAVVVYLVVGVPAR